MTIRALPPGAYIKSMQMGSQDVLDRGLHISGPPGNPLEIVIGANAGTMTGTVSNGRQEPLANRIVALVPDTSLRHRMDLYKSAATDARGHFTMRDIAPGDYKVFAWERVELGAWQDPSFLGTYENSGKSIRIYQGSDASVPVTIIE